MGSHKNFVEWLEMYKRNRSMIIDREIRPYEDAIFNLFGIKFKYDADKDWNRKRIKLKELWYKCAKSCEAIHKILNTNEYIDEDTKLVLTEIVNNIINMDYWSVNEFFNVLKEKYKDNIEIYDALNEVCNNLSKMRNISEKHTNIIKLEK